MRLETKYCLVATATLFAASMITRGARSEDMSYKWSAAASLMTPRSGACSAMLPDGSVMITGGHGPNGTLTSSELFRASGQVVSAAPMMNPRADHVCAALTDGRVLVAGGSMDGGGVTNAAEVYRPDTQTWSAVSTMMAARSGATASMLRDGRVLIAGGEGSGTALATLEIFDPAANTFTAVGQVMSSPRKEHAAAALHDGRILLAGGSNGERALDTVDVYDPATGSLSLLGKLSMARAGLSATTLLDGRIYFTGGSDGSTDLASAEIYNPVEDRFSKAAPMSVARRGHIALRIPNNNSILLVGGTSDGEASAAAELFVPWWNAYKQLPALNGGRAEPAVTALKSNGLVMMAGGANALVQTASLNTLAVPTITTDKQDYQPGDQVTISGANWKPGEVITFNFTRSPNARTLQLTKTADASGNFVFAPFELVMTLDDVNQTYTVNASGNQGSTAQAIMFTDGNVSSASVSIRQANCITNQTTFNLGNTVCASSTVTINGNGTGDYRLQWYAPGFVVGTSIPVRDTLFSNVSNNSTQTDAFQPTSSGTWTVVACKSNNAGSCSSGNITNGTNGTPFTVSGDTTPPVVTSNVVGTLGNNGWYTSNVTVSWTVSDPESTVTSQTGCGPTNVTADTSTSGQTFTCTAISGGGTTSKSVTIKRDATAPTVTGSRTTTANANGWNNSDVALAFTCTDSLSGIATIVATGAATGNSTTSPLNATVSTEGNSQSVQGACTDQAGNTANATVNNVNIDKTPPTATGSALPAPNASGWNNTDVTVTFSGNDALSGIDTCSAATVVATEGQNQTSSSGTCTDKAGNVSAAVSKTGINIDKTAPTVVANASPAPNAAGWNNTDVNVAFVGTDTLSGIASCTPTAISVQRVATCRPRPERVRTRPEIQVRQ